VIFTSCDVFFCGLFLFRALRSVWLLHAVYRAFWPNLPKGFFDTERLTWKLFAELEEP
jgi:hypothetical protein